QTNTLAAQAVEDCHALGAIVPQVGESTSRGTADKQYSRPLCRAGVTGIERPDLSRRASITSIHHLVHRVRAWLSTCSKQTPGVDPKRKGAPKADRGQWANTLVITNSGRPSGRVRSPR